MTKRIIGLILAIAAIAVIVIAAITTFLYNRGDENFFR